MDYQILTIKSMTIKRYIYVVAMALSLIVTSCDKLLQSDDEQVRVEVDFGKIELRVYLNDADGKNLLDPKVEGAYPSSQISLAYNHHTFSVVNLIPATKTRTEDTPEWVALLNRDAAGKAFLQLAWWEALEKCEQRSVTILWGDGSADTIAYSNDYTYEPQYLFDVEKNYGFTFYRSAYLNGRVLSREEYDGSDSIIRYAITRQ